MSVSSRLSIQPLEKRRSVGADIAARLQTMIQDGTFKPGERLPGQRELAQQFGTSMAGVREAISVLSAAGLVEAQAGRGTVVLSTAESAPTFDGWLGAGGDEQGLAELIEARRILEAFTLARAATKVTPAQLDQLHEATETMELHLDQLEAYVQADMRFHLLIAEIAGNSVITRLMRVIQRPLTEQLRRSISHLQANGQLEVNLGHHQQIVEGLARQDLQAAQHAFDEMLRVALEFSTVATGPEQR